MNRTRKTILATIIIPAFLALAIGSMTGCASSQPMGAVVNPVAVEREAWEAKARAIMAMPDGPEKDRAIQQYHLEFAAYQAASAARLQWAKEGLESSERIETMRAIRSHLDQPTQTPPPGYHYEAGGTLLVRDPPTQVEIVNPYGF
jgi:hypothetical protein